MKIAFIIFGIILIPAGIYGLLRSALHRHAYMHVLDAPAKYYKRKRQQTKKALAAAIPILSLGLFFLVIGIVLH